MTSVSGVNESSKSFFCHLDGTRLSIDSHPTAIRLASGGSDVGSGCETIAVRKSDGTFRLHGYKWFSSATDSNMAMTLARIVDADGNADGGSRGLSMFYLEVEAEGGQGEGRVEL